MAWVTGVYERPRYKLQEIAIVGKLMADLQVGPPCSMIRPGVKLHDHGIGAASGSYRQEHCAKFPSTGSDYRSMFTPAIEWPQTGRALEQARGDVKEGLLPIRAALAEDVMLTPTTFRRRKSTSLCRRLAEAEICSTPDQADEQRRSPRAIIYSPMPACG